MGKGTVRTVGILVMLATGGHCPVSDEDVPIARTVGGAYPRKIDLRGARAEEEGSRPIVAFREAAADGQPDALSELAAALVRRAKRRDLESAVEAVMVARRAIDQKPRLAAAHFNLGLALEQLGLRAGARKAFDDASRHYRDAELVRRAEQYAAQVGRREIEVKGGVAQYVAATTDPVSREILQSYAATPRAASVARDADSRLPRTAEIYREGVDSYVNRVAKALQMLAVEGDLTVYATGSTRPGPFTTPAVMRKPGNGSGHWTTTFIARMEAPDGTRSSSGRRGCTRSSSARRRMHSGRSKTRAIAASPRESAHPRPCSASSRRRCARIWSQMPTFARDPAAAFREANEGSSSEEIQHALVPDAAILLYSVTAPGEIMVFVIRRNSVKFVSLPTGLRCSEARVVRAQQPIHRSSNDPRMWRAPSMTSSLRRCMNNCTAYRRSRWCRIPS